MTDPKILEMAYLCLEVDKEPHDDTPLCRRYRERLKEFTPAETLQMMAEVKLLLDEPAPCFFAVPPKPLDS